MKRPPVMPPSPQPELFETVVSWEVRHPERHRQAIERHDSDVAKRTPKPKRALKPKPSEPLTGRAAKDALMPKAREVAESGSCSNWNHVLEVMANGGTDIALLRIWGSAHDKDEIDRICARKLAARPKRRR